MLLDDLPTCKLCKHPIIQGQIWEYSKGYYPNGTPEYEKERVHRACVTKLAGEVSQLMSRVPEERQ